MESGFVYNTDAGFEKCHFCNGQGHFNCEDCLCQRCEQGKVKCPKCTNGQVPCSFCNSTGQISKKGFFFTRSVTCPKCGGSGQVLCTNCNYGRMTCPECNGTGRTSSCSTCNGTRKLQCRRCGCTGRVESEWFKSFKTMPVERLKSEFDSRQQRTHDLWHKAVQAY